MRRVSLSLAVGLLAGFMLIAVSIESAQAAALELTYQAYAAGFRSLKFTVDLNLAPQGYRITLAYRTVGAASLLFPGHAVVAAIGTWKDEVTPQRFESQARWHGRRYDVLVDYPEGEPLVRELVPAEAKRRETVPLAERAGTIDTASAIALLLERMSTGKGCRLELHVFDGRRLMEFHTFPAGTAKLGETPRSFFYGTAKRCDVRGKMLAGFLRSDGPAARRRISRGRVWFARPVAGYPLLPVRIAFSARWFGTSLMYLTDIKTIPAVTAPSIRAPLPTDPANR